MLLLHIQDVYYSADTFNIVLQIFWKKCSQLNRNPCDRDFVRIEDDHANLEFTYRKQLGMKVTSV